MESELHIQCPRCKNWTNLDICPVCKKRFNNLINERLLENWKKMMCEKLGHQNRDCPDNKNGNCSDCRYGNYFTDEKIEYYKLYGKLSARKLLSSNNEETMAIAKSKSGYFVGLLDTKT